MGWNPGHCAGTANTLPTESYSQPLDKHLPPSFFSDPSPKCEWYEDTRFPYPFNNYRNLWDSLKVNLFFLVLCQQYTWASFWWQLFHNYRALIQRVRPGNNSQQRLHTAHGLDSIPSMVVNRLQASHLLLWSCGNAAMTVNLHIISGSSFALGPHWLVLLLVLLQPIKLPAFALWPFSLSPLFFSRISGVLRTLSTFTLHTWSRKMWTSHSNPV